MPNFASGPHELSKNGFQVTSLYGVSQKTHRLTKIQRGSIRYARRARRQRHIGVYDHSLTTLFLMWWQRLENVYRVLSTIFEKPRNTVSACCKARGSNSLSKKLIPGIKHADVEGEGQHANFSRKTLTIATSGQKTWKTSKEKNFSQDRVQRILGGQIGAIK